MPTYAYRCLTCGESFERVYSMSGREKEVPSCPECRSSEVEQTLTSVSVKTSRKS